MERYAPAAKRTLFWTVEKEARLIGLYSKFPQLWDHRHDAYYKKDQRQHALRAIARGLDNEFEVPSVKEKIKSLRDYFVKELKKEEGMRPPGYVCRWPHFQSWAFLRPVIRATLEGQQVVHMPRPPTPPTCTKNKSSSSICSDEASGASGDPIEKAPASSVDVIRMTSETENPTRADGSSHVGVPGHHENDADALFCRRVLSELRQLPSYRRDLTKIRIEQMLFEGKYMTEQRTQ